MPENPSLLPDAPATVIDLIPSEGLKLQLYESKKGKEKMYDDGDVHAFANSFRSAWARIPDEDRKKLLVFWRGRQCEYPDKLVPTIAISPPWPGLGINTERGAIIV